MTCHAGTALKSILARLRIRPAAGCGCEDHAMMMDFRGCDWCEKNIDVVVGWLQEGAGKFGLPAPTPIARMLVQHAIRKARRAALQDTAPNGVR